jgi:hypothetical protein
MYLPKMKEVTTVGKACDAQSHIAQERVPFGFVDATLRSVMFATILRITGDFSTNT